MWPVRSGSTKGKTSVMIPAVTFLESVAGAVPIVPRHVWSQIEDAPRAQEPRVLVGSGPYRLESFSRGEGALLFLANDDYFLGRPYIRRVELHPVDDELTALRAGQIDAADTPPEGVRPQLLAGFATTPGSASPRAWAASRSR